MTAHINQARVLQSMHQLPAFPDVVLKILETLRDTDACLQVLAQYIECDPVVTGHVLSLANRADSSAHGGQPVTDVFTAISLVGLNRVREAVITVCLAGALGDVAPTGAMESFWRQAIATAVCGVEIAQQSPADISVDAALVCCLLRDVGGLWLQRFEPDHYQRTRLYAKTRCVRDHIAERESLGVDHASIGAWLAQAWGLSPAIVQAIEQQHDPEATGEPLAALVHVSEVLSKALDLTGSHSNQVHGISRAGCSKLGLDWGPDCQSLFGRIEARNRHTIALHQA